MNDNNNICLSNWNESPGIYIPQNVSSLLQNYHIIGIRFLYDAFVKKRRGSVLNLNLDMNVPLLVSAFFAALMHVQTREDIVIISKSENTLKWIYYLKTNTSQSDVILVNMDENFYSDSKGTTRIFIIPMHSLDLLKNHPLERIFCTVVEDIELIISKRLIQNLKGDFNVGVTYANFLISYDVSGQYDILHWLDNDKYKRKANFISETMDHYLNLRDPHAEDWLRLTWSYSDTFQKPVEQDKLIEDEKMLIWAKANNVQASTDVSFKKTKSKKVLRKGSQLNIKRANVKTEPTLDNLKTEQKTSVDRASTSGTDTTNVTARKEFIPLPFMDETPMLNSIKKSFSIDSISIQPPPCSQNQSLVQEEIDDAKQELNANESSTSILDSFIFTQDSVLDTAASHRRSDEDYLNSLMNENLSSYDELLDKNVEVDAETQSKLLSAYFDTE